MVMGQTQLKTRISGKIEFPVANQKLFWQLDPSGLGVKSQPQELPLNKDEFGITADIAWVQQGKLWYGDDTIILIMVPGQEIKLSFHGDAPAVSAEFAGAGAADQKFFQAFLKQYGKALSRESVAAQIAANSIDLFELELFTQHENQQKFVAAYREKETVSDLAYNFVVNIIDYHYQAALLSFPVVKGEASKEPRISHLPQIMLAEFKSPFGDDAAIGCPQYQLFLWYAAAYFAYEKAAFMKPANVDAALLARREAAQAKMSGRSLAFALASLTVRNIGFAAKEELTATRDALAKLPDHQPWLAEVDAALLAAKNNTVVAADKTPQDKGGGKPKSKGGSES